MSKNTPGQWAWRGTLGPHSAQHLLGPCVIEVAETGQQLAILSGWRTDKQEADAALMAAAPDLLQALHGLLHNIQRSVCAGSIQGQDEARAAIAMATGEQA